MDNQTGSDNAAAPAEPTKPRPFDWAVAQFKSYLQERRAKKKDYGPADRAAVSTARATWAIAVFTLVTVGIGISHYYAFHGQLDTMRGQLEVMRGQLAEAKGSSAQTDKLIDTNKSLAAATAQMAEFTKRQAETTGSIADRQLRARVSIVSAEIVDFDAGSPIGAKVVVQNAGPGTANGKMRTLLRIAPLTTSKFPIERSALAARVTIHPGIPYKRSARTGHSMSREQQEAIRGGKAAIIAYGDFAYSDESGAVTRCEYRLFSRTWTGQGMPVLEPTADHNYCQQEKAPAR